MRNSQHPINTVGIIGLGFMGTSFVKAINKYLPNTTCVGYDVLPYHNEYALNNGYIAAIVSPENMAKQVDVLILATPVDHIAQLLETLLPEFKGIAITDLGSTKQVVCKVADTFQNRTKYVAAHPFAGSQHSGPSRAHANLYKEAKCFLCNTEASSPEAIDTIARLFKGCGMHLQKMTAIAHDLLMAQKSHLPQLISYVLATTVFSNTKANKADVEVEGSGLNSMLRLAESYPKVWLPIVQQNRTPLIEALKHFEKHIHLIITSLKEANFDTLEALLNNASELYHNNHSSSQKHLSHES